MLSSCQTWEEAFKLAPTLEEEDKNPLKITKKIDEDDYGAFSQPKKLANFIIEVKNSLPPSYDLSPSDSSSTSISTTSNSSSSSTIEYLSEKEQKIEETKIQFSLEARCARQICRTWLKHTFLKLGEPCKAELDCSRLHELPSNPQKLHSDFSFKGLNPKNKKIILDAAKLLAEKEGGGEQFDEDNNEEFKKKKIRI